MVAVAFLIDMKVEARAEIEARLRLDETTTIPHTPTYHFPKQIFLFCLKLLVFALQF